MVVHIQVTLCLVTTKGEHQVIRGNTIEHEFSS